MLFTSTQGTEQSVLSYKDTAIHAYHTTRSTVLLLGDEAGSQYGIGAIPRAAKLISEKGVQITLLF